MDPQEWQKKLDLRAGSELGRIYRVVPDGAASPAIPDLAGLDDAALVAPSRQPERHGA